MAAATQIQVLWFQSYTLCLMCAALHIIVCFRSFIWSLTICLVVPWFRLVGVIMYTSYPLECYHLIFLNYKNKITNVRMWQKYNPVFWSLWKIICKFHKKWNRITRWSRILLLSIFWKVLTARTQIDVCIPLFMAVLLQPKLVEATQCSLMDKWVNKMLICMQWNLTQLYESMWHVPQPKGSVKTLC